MENKLTFLLLAHLVLLTVPVGGEQCQNQLIDCDIINRLAEQRTKEMPNLSTDFENGSPNEWKDESKTAVHWNIEDYNSPWEVDNLPFKPSIGNRYLRVDRKSTFGVAIFRSPTFFFSDEEKYNLLTFDFWLRSTWSKFTNLELFVNENGNEKQLLSLSDYSFITNRNWITISVAPLHDVSPGSVISFVFYAYCGTNVEDAVAIDNIRWTLFNERTSVTSADPSNKR